MLRERRADFTELIGDFRGYENALKPFVCPLAQPAE